jgi:hypothetical protein
MEFLYGAIVGAIIGAVVTDIYNYFKRKYLQERKTSVLKRSLNQAFKTDGGVIALDHAIPYYLKENITLRDTNKSLFVEIPAQYQKSLEEYGFQSRPNTNLSGNSDLQATLSMLNIEDPLEAISRAARQVAEEFIDDFRNGYIRFNGLMFGVDKIRAERLTQDENSGFTISFYKTDYFTYRTFAKIHQHYKTVPGLFDIKNLHDLNTYTTFLSSFGLANFIIINQGNGDEVVIGRRSNAVVVDKGKLHFSMNEAFSMKDVDEYGNPSFSACLFRGLEEELGISQLFKKYVVNHEFLDLIIGTDRFELGITCFARIELNETFTLNTLRELYSIAKDSKLETTSFITVPVKEIDSFIKENYDNISSGCRLALKALNARYKAGYLREES